MGMLVTLAWLTLWIWEQSPYGRYLDHGQWTEIGLAGSICRVLPNGTVVLPALLYIGGWVLMTAAMTHVMAAPIRAASLRFRPASSANWHAQLKGHGS